jgi:hypothetical protein
MINYNKMNDNETNNIIKQKYINIQKALNNITKQFNDKFDEKLVMSVTQEPYMSDSYYNSRGKDLHILAYVQRKFNIIKCEHDQILYNEKKEKLVNDAKKNNIDIKLLSFIEENPEYFLDPSNLDIINDYAMNMSSFKYFEKENEQNRNKLYINTILKHDQNELTDNKNIIVDKNFDDIIETILKCNNDELRHIKKLIVNFNKIDTLENNIV